MGNSSCKEPVAEQGRTRSDHIPAMNPGKALAVWMRKEGAGCEPVVAPQLTVVI